MVRHAHLDDAETFLFQRLRDHRKVQLGCVILGYSTSIPTLSKRIARYSGGIYQLDFLEMLHEVTICSSLQEKDVTCEEKGKNELSCR